MKKYCLKTICTFLPRGPWEKKGSTTGKYPIFDHGLKNNLYTDNYDFDDENVLLDTNVNIIYYQGKFSSKFYILRFKSNNPNVLTKYICYYLQQHKNLIYDKIKEKSIKYITKNDLENIIIPVPSLNDQQIIINKIDNINKQIDIKKQEILKEINNFELEKEKVILELDNRDSFLSVSEYKTKFK